MDDECVQNCAQKIDTIQGCDMGMDKFAGLYKRGGVWWIDIRFPPGYPVKELAGKWIRNSLATSDSKAAQQIRDRLIVPVIAASGEAELADASILFASNAACRLADALPPPWTISPPYAKQPVEPSESPPSKATPPFVQSARDG